MEGKGISEEKGRRRRERHRQGGEGSGRKSEEVQIIWCLGNDISCGLAGMQSGTIKGHGHWYVKCSDHILQITRGQRRPGMPDRPSSCGKSLTIAGWLLSSTYYTSRHCVSASTDPSHARRPPSAVHFLHTKISTRVYTAGGNSLRNAQWGTSAHEPAAHTHPLDGRRGAALALGYFQLEVRLLDYVSLRVHGWLSATVQDDN